MFAKLNRIGFGGKTLSLIQSLYTNDSLRFLINGKYTDELWLTRGVKQGKPNPGKYQYFNFQFIGCNLSPLLFSLFISDLGPLLNSSGLGINLDSINISVLFFADDLVILGQSKEALDKLMVITQNFFNAHKLRISVKKSKIMSHDISSGQTSFPDSTNTDPLTLEAVCCFKYLGIHINSSSRNLFKSFNDNVKKKARNYLSSVLNLVRSGPDRSELAHTLWC